MASPYGRPRRRPLAQPHPQTINPAYLLSRASTSSSCSVGPSNPVSASKTVPARQNHSPAEPTSTPYANRGAEDLWMGSVGYSMRFTRSNMGYGQVEWNTAAEYDAEPLEPLFGETEPLQPLPSPGSEQEGVPEAELGGDLMWHFGRPQSGPIERVMRVMCNREERAVMKRVFINRRLVQ
ncbi:hypothetical protein ACJ41O_003245 [Fusarium nematophilum]